jgi:OOP family OmpA-OmpF porin
MNNFMKMFIIFSITLTVLFVSKGGFAQDVKDSKDYPLLSQLLGGSNDEWTISEEQEMMREVTADDIFKTLSQNGRMRLYIKFETGKDKILLESEPIIDQIVIVLQNKPDLQLIIEGHTDDVGKPESNKKLSEQRAQAVVQAIVNQGIDASRLIAVGWGQEKPIADNHTEEGRAKNRRIEIINLLII